MCRRQRRPLAISGLLRRCRSVAEAGVPFLDRPITRGGAIMRPPEALGRNIRWLPRTAELQVIDEPIPEPVRVILGEGGVMLGRAHRLPAGAGEIFVVAM